MTASARQLLSLGLMWASALMVVQALQIPAADGSAIDWSALLWALPGWCAVGLALAFAADRAGSWMHSPVLAVLTVVLASIALSALWTAIYSLFGAWYVESEWSAARVADPVGAFAYQAWLIAFYGSAYVLAWRLHRRARRSRALLSTLEIMALERRARLDAEELDRLRGRTDPALLLRAISEARLRMARGDPSAEALLARLATFLRAAAGSNPEGRAQDTAMLHRTLLDDLGSPRAQ